MLHAASDPIGGRLRSSCHAGTVLVVLVLIVVYNGQVHAAARCVAAEVYSFSTVVVY
jgi:hypothetical protein